MFTMQFFITSLIVVLIPGTGVIYTVSTGLSRNTRNSIFAAIGCTLGIVPHLLACILGITAIMNISAQIFTFIKILGSLYLFYLAWKTWSSAGKTDYNRENTEKNGMKIIVRGIALNLLNPKLTLFFLSFLPQFIPANTGDPLLPMVLLSLIFMLMTLIVFIFYGLLAGFMSEILLRSKKIMKNIERGFACVFAGLAVDLAVSEK